MPMQTATNWEKGRKLESHLAKQFCRDYPLEIILRRMRAEHVIKEITDNSTILDIGCGVWCYFLHRIKNKAKLACGFDSKAADISEKNLEVKRFTFKDTLPYESGVFDIVTMLATFEHFDNIDLLIAETARVLKSTGKVVMTAPTEKSEKLLKMLANARILNPKEIFSHRRYLNEQDIIRLFEKNNFKKGKIEKFQNGYNCLYIFEKSPKREQ